MNPSKILINGIIAFLYSIVFIILIGQLPRKNMFLSQEEFSVYLGLWLNILALYLGLVNIKDIDPSTNRNSYTIKSIAKRSGFILFFFMLFNIIGIVVTYSRSYPLSLIYIIEHLDFIQIFALSAAYVWYIIGLKINFRRLQNDTESNITSDNEYN